MTLGALVRDPRRALNAERMVALSVAVTEKIVIEKFSLTASSGETGRGRGPQSRMLGEVHEAYNT